MRFDSLKTERSSQAGGRRNVNVAPGVSTVYLSWGLRTHLTSDLDPVASPRCSYLSIVHIRAANDETCHRCCIRKVFVAKPGSVSCFLYPRPSSGALKCLTLLLVSDPVPYHNVIMMTTMLLNMSIAVMVNMTTMLVNKMATMLVKCWHLCSTPHPCTSAL